MVIANTPRQRLSRRYQIYGLAVSLCAHVALLVGLAIANAEPWWLLRSTGWDTNSLEATFSTAEAQVDAPPQPAPVQILPKPGAAEAKPREPELAAEPTQVTSDMVQARLDVAVAKAAKRSDRENLDRLDQMSQRLNQVASPDSVGELVGTFQQLVGIKPRADRPTEPSAEHAAAADFDYETAQFHDVKRYAKQPSGWRYVAVLLDAAGRTIEVEMDEPDGERVYVTLERIKASPLLEQVYRQIAMPLLDQMLGGMKKTAQAKGEKPRPSEEPRPPTSEAP